MAWTIGRVLMVIGIGHAVVGIALFHAPLAAMLRDGVFNSVEPRLVRDGIEAYVGRAAAFWFLLFSPALCSCWDRSPTAPSSAAMGTCFAS